MGGGASYLVILSSLLQGKYNVVLMLFRFVAHHTNERLVILAEEFQGLLVPLTGHLPSFLGYLQLGGNFRNVLQLQVGLQDFFPAGFSAARAEERFFLPDLPVAGDAGSAEIVPTVDRHWVLETLQADRTRKLFLKPRSCLL